MDAFALDQTTAGYPREVPAFQVVRRLHACSMEELFLVRWRSTGHYRALRALHPRHQRDAAALEQFARNADLYRALEHPCLPRYGSLSRKGTDLLSEPLEGAVLSRLREHGPLPAPLSESIQWQLFHALTYLQSHGIYRCEADASRILLRTTAEGPVPQLLDYGFRWPGEQPSGESLNDLVEEVFFQVERPATEW